MVDGAFRRLEALLGAPLGEGLTEANLQRLVDQRVGESEDLEFKREPWGASDAERAELAKDVAAMANGRGGAIVVGVDQDGTGAASLAPFEDAETQRQRVESVVADRVHPMPAMRAFVVSSADAPSRGYLIVAIPRSALAPHAVVRDGALRYPLRYGSKCVYLTESQVADRYRDRFALARGRIERLEEVVREGSSVLDRGEPWVSVAVVPEMAGDVPIDTAAVSDLTAWAQRSPRLPPASGPTTSSLPWTGGRSLPWTPSSPRSSRRTWGTGC